MRKEFLVLFACLLLVGIVLAAGGNLGKGPKAGNGENAQLQAGIQNAGNSGSPGVRAWERYEAARVRYLESLEKWKERRGNWRESALERGKNYVSNSVDFLRRMLEAAEEKISESKRLTQKEKETYLLRLREREMELERLSYSVGNATTARELIEQARLLKNEWKDAREAARLAIGSVGVRKLDAAIDAGWKAAQKADELIDKCNQSGFDVSQASGHLAQFEGQLRLAEQENALANQSFSNQNGNATEGHAHLREAHGHLVEAKKLSNELKKDLRQCVLKRGHVALVGSGWLFAQGSGHVEISGNGTVEANFTGNSSSGKITLIDRAGDALITVHGGNEVKNGQSSSAAKYITMRVWTGAESVEISGSRFTVVLNSNSMQVYAKGTGIAILKGTGTYSAGSEGNSTASQTGAWSGIGAAVRIVAGSR